MILSSNVLKARSVKKSGQPLLLISGSNGQAPSVEIAVQSAKEAAMDIVTRAKEEARAIIEGAEEQALSIRNEAKNQGYDEGLRAGVRDGQGSAQQEWSVISSGISGVLARIEQLRVYTHILDTEMVLAQAAAMTAKFLDKEADSHPERLKTYLTALLESLEDEKVTLFLSEEFHHTLEGLTREWGSLWEPVQLAVDRQLEGLAVRVETQEGESFLAGPLAALTRILDEVLYGSV